MNTTVCEAAIFFSLLTVLILAAYYDIRWRRIPNWLTYPAMGTGLILHCACTGVGGCISSTIGMLAGFSYLVIFYLFNAIGGGDVKLMAAVGALVGFESIIQTMFWTACIGAVMAVIFIKVAAYRSRSESQSGSTMSSGDERSKLGIVRPLTIPYGIAIAGGTLFTLFFS